MEKSTTPRFALRTNGVTSPLATDNSLNNSPPANLSGKSGLTAHNYLLAGLSGIRPTTQDSRHDRVDIAALHCPLPRPAHAPAIAGAPASRGSPAYQRDKPESWVVGRSMRQP